jgi:hypothetical protein
MSSIKAKSPKIKSRRRSGKKGDKRVKKSSVHLKVAEREFKRKNKSSFKRK